MELKIIAGLITMGVIIAICLILSFKLHDRYERRQARIEKEKESCCK